MHEKRTRRLSAVLLWTAVASAAGAQHAADLIQPTTVTPAPADALAHAHNAFGDHDAPIPRPGHPPIDQIPPMPIPDGTVTGIFDHTAWDGLSLYDAETGLTIDLPSHLPSGLDAGELADGSLGTGGIDGGFEATTRGFGTMGAINSAATFPRRGNVKIVTEFTDTSGTLRYFVGSGTMADPGVVLTAAHIVYAHSPNGINIFDFANQIWVYPGWDGNGSITGGPASDEVIDEWGWARGTQYLINNSYVNDQNFDRDIAAIRINASSRNVGMLTGWFGMAWGGSCNTIQNRTYYNYSYPAENCGGALHTGATLYYWDGDWDSCPDNQLKLDTGGNCLDTVWGGMSGSGAFYFNDTGSRLVQAVCSTSNRNDNGYYCELWEAFFNSIQGFEDTTRGTSLDLEPLMFRLAGSTTIQAGDPLSDATVQMCNPTDNNPASDTYTLRLYLSGNNNISESDTLLATYNYTTNFTTVDERTWNVPGVTIPVDTAPGDYFLGVVLDAGADSYFTNNDTDTWDAQPITVTLPPAPGIANGAFPANFATNVPVNADLNWFNTTNTETYSTYFGTDATPDNSEYLGDSATSFRTLGTLDYNTTYYWRIDTNGNAQTTTGTVWRFTTEPQAPGQPTAPTPAQNATDVPRDTGLSWTAGVNTDTFSVYFGTSEIPSDLVLVTGANAAGIPGLLDPDTVYHWQIEATSPEGLSTRSPVWRFQTLALTCPCDIDGTPGVAISDLLEYLTLWFDGDPAAETNGTGTVDVADLLTFLSCWFDASNGATCP